jgi:hypothetical protein
MPETTLDQELAEIAGRFPQVAALLKKVSRFHL